MVPKPPRASGRRESHATIKNDGLYRRPNYFSGGTVGEVDGSDPGPDRDGDGGPAALVLRRDDAGRDDAEAGRNPPGPAVQGVLTAGGHEDRAGARAQPAAGRPDGQTGAAAAAAAAARRSDWPDQREPRGVGSGRPKRGPGQRLGAAKGIAERRSGRGRQRGKPAEGCRESRPTKIRSEGKPGTCRRPWEYATGVATKGEDKF